MSVVWYIYRKMIYLLHKKGKDDSFGLLTADTTYAMQHQHGLK